MEKSKSKSKKTKMSKEYLHVIDVDIPIYEGKLVIVLTNSIIKIQKYLPDFKRSDIYAHAWYDNYKGKAGYYMIFNFDNKGGKITHGTISHEAMHLTHYIADIRGFKPDFNNDEPLCYIIGWITDQAYKFINKKKFKVQ